MKIEIYQVDAFAEKVFQGNPAAVCPLETWLDDDILQKIAEENNLSETAFVVPDLHGGRHRSYQLRWFTPAEEVDLCGHATLAAAHVLYAHLGHTGEKITFHTKSGALFVSRGEGKQQGSLSMDFPADLPKACTAPQPLLDGLGLMPKEVLASFDYVVVIDNEEAVRALTPDFSLWQNLDLRGVVVTAQGRDVDFVSRCFYPGLRVNEDPVTGSAHCLLAPYWKTQLGKTKLTARQLSTRGGVITCSLVDDRVILSGTVREYMQGTITLPD